MKLLASVLALAVAAMLLIAFGVLDGDGGGAALPPTDATATAYLTEAEATTGMRNVVGSVLVHYRGFDTFVEVLVIVTALMAVLGLGLRSSPEPRDRPGVPVDPVVRFVVALLAPYVALFALALLVRGHEVPGGGFASGAVAAALVVAVTFVAGDPRRRTSRWGRAFTLAPALAPLAFAAALALSAAGAWAGPEARAWLGSAIEAAIAVTAATVLARLFLALERDPAPSSSDSGASEHARGEPT